MLFESQTDKPAFSRLNEYLHESSIRRDSESLFLVIYLSNSITSLMHRGNSHNSTLSTDCWTDLPVVRYRYNTTKIGPTDTALKLSKISKILKISIYETVGQTYPW